ncbi:polyprenyl synthetase family protein [Actinoplanes xinjiangensis]|nr:farnesyl diphosphate synthase [Actinoplanes xinjiangensis]
MLYSGELRAEAVAEFDLAEYLHHRQEIVNNELERAVLPAYPEQLFDSMRYSLMSGGKRLRPALCIAGCEAGGGTAETALACACALEMLHTATLIHDDLPAMDNDDYRRGRLSNHKVFGEAIALLAGDALLAYSLEFLMLNTRGVPPDRMLRVMQILIQMVGVDGAVGGQVVDLSYEGRDIDLETLEYIHTHKTGALLVAAVVTGAVLAGADEDTITRLRSYAQKLGLAFQIVDDILDVTSTREVLGKTPHKDEQAGKATFPRLLGLDASRRRAAELITDAKRDLAPLGVRAVPLLAIADFVGVRMS